MWTYLGISQRNTLKIIQMEEYTSKRLMEEGTRDRYQEYFRLTGNETMIKAAVGGQNAISEDTEKNHFEKFNI